MINLGCAPVDNHIPRDDIFDYHTFKDVTFIYYKFVLEYRCPNDFKVKLFGLLYLP